MVRTISRDELVMARNEIQLQKVKYCNGEGKNEYVTGPQKLDRYGPMLYFINVNVFHNLSFLNNPNL